MTSKDLQGLPRTYNDLLGISMISYDFIMILQWLYKEQLIVEHIENAAYYFWYEIIIGMSLNI